MRIRAISLSLSLSLILHKAFRPFLISFPFLFFFSFPVNTRLIEREVRVADNQGAALSSTRSATYKLQRVDRAIGQLNVPVRRTYTSRSVGTLKPYSLNSSLSLSYSLCV